MATTTNKSTQSTFDFDTYNRVMKNANSGLKLYLAERLLQDVQGVMVRFKSPLRNDITSIVDEVGSLRENNKKYLASRERSANEEIDNATTDSPVSTSADGGRLSDVTGKTGTVLHTETPLPDAPL